MVGKNIGTFHFFVGLGFQFFPTGRQWGKEDYKLSNIRFPLRVVKHKFSSPIRNLIDIPGFGIQEGVCFPTNNAGIILDRLQG